MSDHCRQGFAPFAGKCLRRERRPQPTLQAQAVASTAVLAYQAHERLLTLYPRFGVDRSGEDQPPSHAEYPLPAPHPLALRLNKRHAACYRR